MTGIRPNLQNCNKTEKISMTGITPKIQNWNNTELYCSNAVE